MKLTILTENTANKRGMLAEHGLSVLAEHKGQRFLFDTGQSDVYLKNAAKLGISLKPLDGVVFSHGHYDHCDGFGYGLDLLAEEGSTLKVYTGQGAFSARTYTAPGTDKPRNVGSSWRPDTLPDMAKKSITFIQT